MLRVCYTCCTVLDTRLKMHRAQHAPPEPTVRIGDSGGGSHGTTHCTRPAQDKAQQGGGRITSASVLSWTTKRGAENDAGAEHKCELNCCQAKNKRPTARQPAPGAVTRRQQGWRRGGAAWARRGSFPGHLCRGRLLHLAAPKHGAELCLQARLHGREGRARGRVRRPALSHQRRERLRAVGRHGRPRALAAHGHIDCARRLALPRLLPGAPLSAVGRPSVGCSMASAPCSMRVAHIARQGGRAPCPPPGST